MQNPPVTAYTNILRLTQLVLIALLFSSLHRLSDRQPRPPQLGVVSIRSDQITKFRKKPFAVLDLRSEIEFQQSRIRFSNNVTESWLHSDAPRIYVPGTQFFVVGGDSAKKGQLLTVLVSLGHREFLEVTDGFAGWRANLPDEVEIR